MNDGAEVRLAVERDAMVHGGPLAALGHPLDLQTENSRCRAWWKVGRLPPEHYEQAVVPRLDVYLGEVAAVSTIAITKADVRA